jgi:hypothetical protein
MRLAPVPMFYFKSPQEAIGRAAESSRTTRGAQTAVDACCCFAGILVGALGGVDKDITAFSPGLWVALPGFDSWPSGLGVGEGPIRTTTNESRLVETFSIPGVSRPAGSRPGFLCRNSAVAAGAHYK